MSGEDWLIWIVEGEFYGLANGIRLIGSIGDVVMSVSLGIRFSPYERYKVSNAKVYLD